MSTFKHTEEALQAFISDCVETLKAPLCPVVEARTHAELDMWWELWRGLEKEQRDWEPASPVPWGQREEKTNA